MKRMKIFIILIAGFLWIAPNAFAFFEDDGQSSEEGNMIQDMMHKKAYHDMVEEKKRKSEKAMLRREKRKATLTPFVYDTPQELSNLSKQKNDTIKKDPPQKGSPKKVSLLAAKTDAANGIPASIIANFFAIIACFIGFIFLSRYFRAKK